MTDIVVHGKETLNFIDVTNYCIDLYTNYQTCS